MKTGRRYRIRQDTVLCISGLIRAISALGRQLFGHTGQLFSLLGEPRLDVGVGDGE